MMTDIACPPNRTSSYNFKLLKIQDQVKMTDGRHLEKLKNVVIMDIINRLLKTGNKTANINVKTAVYTHC